MPQFPKLVPLVAIVVAGAASAQLDLPSGHARRPKDPAGVLTPPAPPRGDLAPGGDAGALVLPPSATPAPEVAAALPAAVDDDQRARQIFAELNQQRALELVPRAVERLLALDEAGRIAARGELSSPRAASLLAAARTCLRSGDASDREAVADRLTRTVPSEIAVTLLDDLLAADPVVASPQYLCGLLEHDCAPLRNHVEQVLEPLLSSDVLPALAPRLSSRRSTTRTAAIDLIARIEDPAAEHLLVSELGDPSAQVAARVATLLAARPGSGATLMSIAFPVPSGTTDAPAPSPLDWDRARAYALLALVQRVEASTDVQLDNTRVPDLLAGLQSPQAIVAGSCAVALTHIGYRSPPAGPTSWLDREVPHALVRYGTGAVFHSDFSALAPPALRAFGLLTGKNFGQDGEAARRYWAVNADGFRARRGVIELGSDPAAHLCLSFDDGVDGAWTLRSGTQPLEPGRAPSTHTLLLDDAVQERLLARLTAEGIFDFRRPPTLEQDPDARWLRVEVDGQEKRFAYQSQAEPEWFATLLAELRARVSDERWQLLFDPARVGSQHEWWAGERERFSDERTPLERRLAFKALVMERARSSSGADRAPFVAELERLFAEVGVAEGSDFEPLVELARSERGPGPRLETLLGLARVAAGLARESAAAAPRERDPVEELFWVGVEQGGEPLRAVLERVARDLPPGAGENLAKDDRPLVRSLAPAALATEGARAGDAGATARTRLVALLSDPDPAVVQAALRALAEQPCEEARSVLDGLARGGDPAQRGLALRALGRLGGGGVFDLVLLAMAEPEQELHVAAIEALADLGDPRSASLCASLLARGSDSPLYEPARRTLVRLGEAGRAECLRLARSASSRTRREAVLFLAQEGEPEAASLLITLLTDDPGDSAVAWELAVLSATDLRHEQDPARAWWAWWDMVVHDDALAWLLAASERAGVGAPPRAELEDPGDPRGARFLLSLVVVDDEALVERAARELERRLGHSLPRPASARERGAWRADVAAAVEARFGR